MMISYAQNHEDVMLERVFRTAPSGFYVDVGASDPEDGSLTKHFYDRGWRGINIEPGSWFSQIASARPRDINVNVAVSDSDGAIDFYERPGFPGLSSVIAEPTAALQGEAGDQVLRRVPARTLRSIFDEIRPPQIDFMSIDVERHEEQVIRGNDWDRFRPRVLVVEATLPNTTVLCHQAWEPLLLAAGYRFVFFNGINRFYVREEDAGLADHFQTPVTALDPFISVHQHHLRRVNEQLRDQLAHLNELLNHYCAQVKLHRAQLKLQEQRHAELLGGASGRSLRLGLKFARLLQRAVRGARRIIPVGLKRPASRLAESDHGGRA